MAGRKSRYLEVDRTQLVDNGLLRFDGLGLACPSTNVPTLDDLGSLTVYAPIRQPNGVTKVVGVHRYVVNATDSMLLVDGNHGPITIVLPEIKLPMLGLEVIIKDSAGTAAQQNITIEGGNPRDTIEGAASLIISTSYGLYKLLCDGESWLVTSKGT